ncbi:hypothetical protein FKM82_005525 [Ascaphus truei]
MQPVNRSAVRIAHTFRALKAPPDIWSLEPPKCFFFGLGVWMCRTRSASACAPSSSETEPVQRIPKIGPTCS